MKQPCDKNCPDRNGECHSKCEKWLEYERERNARYKEIAIEKQLTSDMREIEIHRRKNIHTGKLKRRRGQQ